MAQWSTPGKNMYNNLTIEKLQKDADINSFYKNNTELALVVKNAPNSAKLDYNLISKRMKKAYKMNEVFFEHG